MKHKIFYYPTCKLQAEAMVEADPRLQLGTVNWDRFPDKFPNLFVTNMDELASTHVALLMSITSPETVFEQMSVFYALAAQRPASLRVLLPYFPTGTMERVDHEGQVATAHTLAQMFSAVGPAGPGPVPLYIWDAHALALRHFFGPNIAPRFKSGVKRLTEGRLTAEHVVVFPDDGALKRFKVMFSNEKHEPIFPLAVCRKVREGEKRFMTLLEGSVEGKHAVIVDDLVHSGGTILECKKALDAKGASQVSVFVTHAVMENGAWKKFLDAGFDTVWVTDSVPETAALVDGHKPFEVATLIPSMTRAVFEGLE
jgi:ribose-phosphate pyrophosphokinase